MKKLKVIQWGPGYIGTQGIKYIIRHPNLQLVGVKCFSDHKVGVDAGALCGLPEIGVKAVKDERALLALDADCVVFTCGDTSMQNPVPGTLGHEFIQAICRILESGKNVVATTPMQMVYPRAMGVDGESLVSLLNDACVKGNTTVHFVGFEPGFMGDTLASILSSVSMDITSMRTFELVDWANYDKHDTLRALGIGCRPDDPSRPFVLELFKNIWKTTVQEMADIMDIELEEIRIWDRPVLAPESFITSGGLEIPKGTVAVARWALEGLVQGVPRVAIEHCNRMRSDLAPELPSVKPGGGYRIEIESNELPLSVDIHLGHANKTCRSINSFNAAMFGTAARAINAVEMICAASPGYKSKDDLPHPITGRHAMWL